jgi:hypothetical protein
MSGVERGIPVLAEKDTALQQLLEIAPGCLEENVRVGINQGFCIAGLILKNPLHEPGLVIGKMGIRGDRQERHDGPVVTPMPLFNTLPVKATRGPWRQGTSYPAIDASAVTRGGEGVDHVGGTMMMPPLEQRADSDVHPQISS